MPCAAALPDELRKCRRCYAFCSPAIAAIDNNHR